MAYLIGDKKTFLDFLNTVTKEDKIAILSHDDLDGIASCVLLEKILEKKNLNPELIEFMTIKQNMLKGKLEELKEKKITKIFMADLACDDIDCENFEELKEGIDTLLIDHHPISSQLKNKENIIKAESYDCATKMIFELGEGLLDSGEWGWLLCSAMFAEFSYTNKENFELMKEFYPSLTEENMATSIPGINARKISSAILYFDKDLNHVREIITKKRLDELNHAFEMVEDEINKATEDFSKNKVLFEDKKIFWYEFSPKYNIASIVATIASKMMPEYSFLVVTAREGYTKVSARNQSGDRDMSQLMKKGVATLTDAGGGGHVRASAAKFKTEDLEKFKKNILRD